MAKNIISEEMLDNLLVGQKDRILSAINDKEYVKAIAMLGAVWELWKATSYSYKGREVCDRLLTQIREAIMGRMSPGDIWWQDFHTLDAEVCEIAVEFCD